MLAVALVVGKLFGAGLTEKPGVFALGAVLLLGLIHLVANGIDERPNLFVIGKTLGYACLVGVVYFALQYGAERVFAGALPSVQTLHGPLGVTVVTVVVISFAIVTFLQGLVPGYGSTPRSRAIYAHVANGLYVNTLANRFVLRYWPPRAKDVA